MATCASCNNIILFGGIKEGGRRFCGARCHQAGQFLKVADTIPDDLVEQQAAAIHGGPCPNCRREGPVDFHDSKRVLSFILLTSSKTTPHLVCPACAKSRILSDTLLTAFCGWWGFPFGLIFTPAAIASNIGAMSSAGKAALPSPRLKQFAREYLAAMVDEEARRPQLSADAASPPPIA
jgi:hypothetical protein